ncbi:RNA-directed DNA polymerase, partial [Candidatus Sumerlaeota bacterium]
MGFWDLFKSRGPDQGHHLEELARRLGMPQAELLAVTPAYREFDIAKRGGGKRRILAPEPELKALQRRILRRLLGRLATHPAATGF